MIQLALVLAFWLQGPAPQNGVLTGTLRANDGSTLAGVRVVALAARANGTYTESEGLGLNSSPPASTALTDAQGRFRLENVPPGRYYIRGGLDADPTYYPDAGVKNQSNATAITVAAGQTVDNLNFKLLGSLGQRVSGKISLNLGLTPGQLVTLTGSKVEEFLSIPVRPDGTFEFGRVPSGLYLLSTFPPPPGLLPLAVPVRTSDVTGLELNSPPTHVVTGRIVMSNGGPIPLGILSFYNTQSYVGATVSPDGTFTAKLHAARHQVDVAGMPVGYNLVSVRLGSTDASKGFTVGNADVSGLVVTVSAPAQLPHVRGTVSGLAAARLTNAKVELTGPVFNVLQSAIRADGSFDFPIMVPGLYTARLLNVPEFKPVELVVTSQALTTVTLTVK